MRVRVLSVVLGLAVSSSLLLPTTLLNINIQAQSFTPKRELKNLSPSALTTLHTLETLTELPAGDWRLHVGDVPHGESPALDDSGWQLVAPHSTAPKDAVWYRRTVEVPKTLNGYDITGSRVWFQFRAEANGPMPEIIYFNGRRVALGDDLEPIILFDPAKPGDKVLVAVKLAHTVDEKTFAGVNLKIEPNPNATGAAARPNPEDIRTQCITAANLLPALATPRKDLLPKVEEAVAAIDIKALQAGNQSAFDSSLRKSQEILSTLHPVLSQAIIDEDGNSHIDAAEGLVVDGVEELDRYEDLVAGLGGLEEDDGFEVVAEGDALAVEVDDLRHGTVGVGLELEPDAGAGDVVAVEGLGHLDLAAVPDGVLGSFAARVDERPGGVVEGGRLAVGDVSGVEVPVTGRQSVEGLERVQLRESVGGEVLQFSHRSEGLSWKEGGGEQNDEREDAKTHGGRVANGNDIHKVGNWTVMKGMTVTGTAYRGRSGRAVARYPTLPRKKRASRMGHPDWWGIRNRASLHIPGV